jgi:cell division septation protein DedD
MKFEGIVVFTGLLAILATGCKKDDEQARQMPLPPPVDTTSKIDTSAIPDIDTMPAVEPVPDLPSAPAGSGYVIQVASATDAKYARYLVNLWRGRGYEPFVTTTAQNNETHYRIRLGLYDSQAQAKSVVAELEDKYSLKTWIDQM